MLLGVLACPVARAEAPPSIWEGIRDPEAREDWKTHVTVQRKLVSKDLERMGPFTEVYLDSARILLEDARAAERAGPLLRFDLGYVYEAQSLHVRAAAVLEAVLRDAPDDPSAVMARMELASAYVHLERFKEERDTYIAYLRTAPPNHRAVALLNLAEAEMRLGNMREAIAGYHEAFDASGDAFRDHETQVLAVWGLAVALDRSGDTRSAMREAALAVSLDPGLTLIAHGENVFFVPSYERNYYVGLGWLAEAQKTQSKDEQEAALNSAERAFSAYVKEAVPTDPWLPQAKRHLADTTAQIRLLRSPSLAKKRAGSIEPNAPRP